MEFYEKLLGKNEEVEDFPLGLQLTVLTEDQQATLVAPFSQDDVLKTFKAMAKNKSPGPDGLTTEFYIAAWNIVGTEVSSAVLYFFTSLHLPRIVNSTAIALV